MRSGPQPRCLVYRSAEAVISSPSHITRTYTDTDAQKRATMVGRSCDTVMHCDRARNGIAARLEHRHKPVAGVLDLATVMQCERGPERLVVQPEYFIGTVVTEVGAQRGRTYDVCEQDRQCLDRAQGDLFRTEWVASVRRKGDDLYEGSEREHAIGRAGHLLRALVVARRGGAAHLLVRSGHQPQTSRLGGATVAVALDVASLRNLGRKRPRRRATAFGAVWYWHVVTVRRRLGGYLAITSLLRSE